MNTFTVTICTAFVALGKCGPALLDLNTSAGSIVIGDTVYFTDSSTTLRSRDEAVDFCQSWEADLAKITNKTLYDTLRLAVSEQGAYWIDGIDKSTLERFDFNNTCTSEEVDFSGMQPENLVLTPKQCLALVKGTSARDSRIQATDCIIPHRVLCSHPINGYAVPTTSTTTMASGDSVL